MGFYEDPCSGPVERWFSIVRGYWHNEDAIMRLATLLHPPVFPRVNPGANTPGW